MKLGFNWMRNKDNRLNRIEEGPKCACRNRAMRMHSSTGPCMLNVQLKGQLSLVLVACTPLTTMCGMVWIRGEIFFPFLGSTSFCMSSFTSFINYSVQNVRGLIFIIEKRLARDKQEILQQECKCKAWLSVMNWVFRFFILFFTSGVSFSYLFV